jgi:ligand-binding sensor domain-containing protein/signal transduction histidine kinase/DNA-binding response OmpR family regulator
MSTKYGLNRYNLLVFLLQLLISVQSYSQELVGASLTIKDGLVDPSIYSIVQDKRGLMWFGSWKGLSSYDTREFKIYKNDPNNPRSISADFIRACHSDSKGRLWFGTNWGLNLYDPATDSFDRFLKDSSNANSLSDNMIICLMEDDQGDLWVGTSNGVNRVRTVGNKVTIERYLSTENPEEKKKYITAMYKDPDGIIWVSASHALMAIDPRKEKTEYMSFPFEGDPENKSVLTLYGDKAGNMWIGSRWKGLGRFDRKHKNFHSFKNIEETSEEKSDVLSVMQIIPSHDGNLLLRTSRGILSYNVAKEKLEQGISDYRLRKKLRISGLLRIYLDSEDNLWIGTLADGLHFMTRRNNFFIPISLKNRETNVEQVLRDPSNNLWFQSYDRDSLAGTQNTWYQLDKTNRSLVPVSVLPGYTSRSYFDRYGTLWLGLWNNVIVNYKVVAGKLVEQGRYVLPHIPSSTDDQITVIGEDQTKLLVGTAFNGLYLFDREKGTFRQHNVLTRTKTGGVQKRISSLFNDSKNNLWIGTSFGVTKISPNGRRQFFQTASVTQESSTNKMVNIVHEDTHGQIWLVLSNDGLYLYDSAKNAFVPKNQSKEINGYNVTNIQHDDQGNLWLSNELGIVEYNIAKGRARQFFFHDGIPGSRLMTNSSLKTQDGCIYFTTNNGAVYFNPKNIPFNRKPPTVIFTQLRLFNKPVTIGDQTEILKQSLTESDEITFHHSQSIFSIDFASLSFVNTEKNEYAYKLDGFEKEWNYVKIPTATYTNLPAGKYTLLVKGTNSDGVWSSKEAALKIIILPPWWNTWYAWLVYTLVTIGLLYWLMRFLLLRNSLEKEKQLNDLKLNFFTNISHEIRTRLMLITGPVNELLRSSGVQGKDLTLLEFVNKSSKSLLNLVNELMDFRKMESGSVPFIIGEYNVVSTIKNVVSAFEHLAQAKNITTSLSTDEKSIMVWYDSEQFQKVIYNLLANAYKFTGDGGRVDVLIRNNVNSVEIEISDNGIGIAPEYLDKLYNNYFQVAESMNQSTGYGVGLALSKAIMENLKGSLEVSSRVAVGSEEGLTTFKATLHKGKEHFKDEQLAVQNREKETEIVVETTTGFVPNEQLKVDKKYSILFAEDNKDLQAFVSEILGWKYEIIFTGNGEEGWEMALEQLPDLIVSDVMMPVMDGIQFCKKVKSDVRTSHIPVILLTAKTARISHLEGLESGADLYLTKPISMDVLELNIKNLLNSRALMQQKYSRHIFSSTIPVDIGNNIDDKFLNTITHFIEDNLESREVNVQELCRHIGMSKSVLYKKLRALTDMTINEFIRNIRFRVAARLLAEGNLKIQEVAYKVGYDDKKYFSKEFKKHFGTTPSEFA